LRKRHKTTNKQRLREKKHARAQMCKRCRLFSLPSSSSPLLANGRGGGVVFLSSSRRRRGLLRESEEEEENRCRKQQRRRRREEDEMWKKKRRKVAVVLGGGVAGAKCAEELLRLNDDHHHHHHLLEVVLIERSEVLKLFRCRKDDEDEEFFALETVAVEDFRTKSMSRVLVKSGGRLRVVRGEAIQIDGEKQTVTVRVNDDDDDNNNNNNNNNTREIAFDQICFAVGARPKRLPSSSSSSSSSRDDIVKYVRDTESAEVLGDALRKAFLRSRRGGTRAGGEDGGGDNNEDEERSVEKSMTRIVVSGNGAVAMEIVNALDESFLQMVMSFVKAELDDSSSVRVVGDGGSNRHLHHQKRRRTETTETEVVEGGVKMNKDNNMKKKMKTMIEALKRMQVVWVVKHEAIGDALFDRDASAFLLEHRRARREAARRKILGEIVAHERRNANNYRKDDEYIQSNEEANAPKKNGTTKQFTFDEKISYPRRRGAFGATVCAKTSSAGPDWFKRINQALLFDDISDDEDCNKSSARVEEKEEERKDNVDDCNKEDDRENVEEKENERGRGGAYLTSVVNALFEVDWLSIEANCEIKDVVPFVEKSGYKTATVRLSNNKTVSDVLVVAACIGVEPNGGDLFGDEATARETFGFVRGDDAAANSPPSSKGNDGDNTMFITDGLRVTETFELELPNKPNVFFAAGDCALCERRNEDKSTNWFQMRSWSQAAQSGAQCARSMLQVDGYEYGLGFNFELFTHSTTFFGLKVILLGSFNLQKFLPEADEKDVRILSRKFIDDGSSSSSSIEDAKKNNSEEKGEDYFTSLCSNSTFIRVVTYKGKVVGAVLVGETNLEETFENLIQDKIDVSHLENDLLDPDVDIEDYFD
jgi:NADH dehydrogenase FAD-containing subunit